MASDTITLVRKLKLFPVGDKAEIDRVYKFIRDGQYNQYRAMNLIMGQLLSKYYECDMDIKSPIFKESMKTIVSNNNPIIANFEFAKGCDTKSFITQKIRQDFSTALKNGLAKGERTITNYKRTNPLMTRGRDIKIVHEYKDYQEFLDKLYTDDLKLYIKWINKIKFEIILGNPHRSEALRSELQQIIEGHYKVQGSSIMVKDKSIILNLSISIPKEKIELDKNIIVGVDLGLAIPAVCALNNNKYERCYIGNYDDFVRVRTQLQSQRRRIQRSLKTNAGGHGRTKKLQALERLQSREKNFAKTYNHMVSHQVIEFAKKHRAAYINLEDLSGYDGSEFVLRNWSYYQLQADIQYKADKVGIKVNFVKPSYTSQTCSCCGNLEEGQRTEQARFVCKKCGYEENADFNGARNIAMRKK